MKILYEDSQMIVCYKESGLPVQSARIGSKDLESILKNYLREKTEKVPYLGVVHRLDQPVEGVLVFAKTPQAAAELGAQVQDGRMRKCYRAVTERSGETSAREGTLRNDLLKDGKTNTSRIVSAKTKGAKRAELDYVVLKETEVRGPEESGEEVKRLALVEIQLRTGRHHQIRVQMSGAGMPLLGDRKYGTAELFGKTGALALCAVSLELIHPRTGKKMQFTCEPQGEYFQLF